ncbi:MAG: hypothetical protein H0Z19_07285 [Archaeoglobus sp.]|uniref:hypothetical protein n=1 Tax=Archaeoglobus sp. TaxID=1872626 RepID=UPI001D73A5A0|nr:hypothetical protein [Archaeoglobus sp.]MBO8180267.1 hypothetical protein [Archaeoglobus sp.]
MLYGDILSIRALTGLTSEDISDEDITQVMQLANRIVLNTIQIRVTKEQPRQIGGDRTVYQTISYPLADIDGDGQVTANDIKVEALNPVESFNMWRELAVDQINPYYGLIKLAEAPTNGERVFVTYAYIPEWVKKEDIDDLVNLLTAHILTLRLQNPDTVAITDLGANELIVKKQETKFLEVYKLKLQTLMNIKAMRSVEL